MSWDDDTVIICPGCGAAVRMLPSRYAANPMYRMRPHDCSWYCGAATKSGRACLAVGRGGAHCVAHGGNPVMPYEDRRRASRYRKDREERDRKQRERAAYVEWYAQRRQIAAWFAEGGGTEAFAAFAERCNRA